MKRRRPPPEWAAKKRPPPGSTYEVGYCRPPESTKFRDKHPGKGGRPKGAKNKHPLFSADTLQSTVLDEANRRIKLNEAGKQITLPVLQAAIRAMAVAAVKGHPLAQRSFVRVVEAAQQAKLAGDQEYLDIVLGYKAHWEEELHRRRIANIAAPDPIPHPDDIIIDPRAGTITITGPMTAEEKPKWNKLRARKQEFEESAEWLKSLMAEADSEDYAAFLLEMASEEEKMADLYSAALDRMAHRA